MKNDDVRAGGSFRGKVLSSIIYSLLITCAAEFFLVRSLLVAADFGTEVMPDNRVFRGISEFRVTAVLLFVLFGIFLFSLVFWILQRRSFVYISRISETMEDIASGDLDSRVEVDGDDEFSEMAENLNRMAADLKKLMESERESERSKNELITNVAHDLRTPLTSIIGYLEILTEKQDIDAETRLKYTEIAYSKSRKLQQLINDLFGFTKLGYGELSLRRSDIDLVKLLAQLVMEFYPNFTEAGLEYEFKSNVKAFPMNADANLLARLFENLITNAIKYGSEGKRIRVHLFADQRKAEVRVINYGRIIPAEDLPQIFEKFYRVEQSRSSNTGGTGLGLAIARNIAELHGGTISVTSDLSGTVFLVTLPADSEAAEEAGTAGKAEKEAGTTGKAVPETGKSEEADHADDRS